MPGLDDPILITREGLRRLEDELESLRTVRRAEVAQAIRDAQEFGFAQADAQYEDAKNQQAFLEGRIQEIERMLERAEVIDEEAAHASKEVRVGSTVNVRSEDGKKHTYQVVGPAEADPGEGRISHESPVGRALLGKKRGDKVTVTTPRGEMQFSITAVN